ncbi:MAG: hypothetical protein AAF773_24580 [Cyanobacteria bacterium P01_D01_bin.115]
MDEIETRLRFGQPCEAFLNFADFSWEKFRKFWQFFSAKIYRQPASWQCWILLGVLVNLQKICVLLRCCRVMMMRFGWQKIGARLDLMVSTTQRMTVSPVIPMDAARFHILNGRAQIGALGTTALLSGKVMGIHRIGRQSQVLVKCKKGKCSQQHFPFLH